MAEATKKNLYRKLLDITEAVGKIEKTGRNTAQNYSFTEYAQVVAEIRVQLAKHGVIILPETVERTMERYTSMKPGHSASDPPKESSTFHANVKSRYTLVNADDPTETMVLEWDGGEALDTSDKASNKAMTASHKSFLMKLFNISDKDDPDAHSPEIEQADPLPSVPAELPARQIKEDVDESKGVELDTLTKLYGAIKTKGISEKGKATTVLNNLATMQYKAKTIKDMSESQAQALYAYLRLPTTKLEALEMLTEA